MPKLRAALQRAACPHCGSSDASAITYSDTQEFRNLVLDLEGLTASICANCGRQWFTAEQTQKNNALLKQVYAEKRDSLRTQLGLLSGEQIEQIRTLLKLNQREASELFGGGPKSFNKYESGEVLQSQAMDKLLRLTVYFGDEALDMITNPRSFEEIVRHHARVNEPEELVPTTEPPYVLVMYIDTKVAGVGTDIANRAQLAEPKQLNTWPQGDAPELRSIH